MNYTRMILLAAMIVKQNGATRDLEEPPEDALEETPKEVKPVFLKGTLSKDIRVSRSVGGVVHGRVVGPGRFISGNQGRELRRFFRSDNCRTVGPSTRWSGREAAVTERAVTVFTRFLCRGAPRALKHAVKVNLLVTFGEELGPGTQVLIIRGRVSKHVTKIRSRLDLPR